jgi:subtilase family serine protease
VPNSVFTTRSFEPTKGGTDRSQGRTGRAVPDISAVGDPNTACIVGETQTFSDGSVTSAEYRLGASLSSPLIAGIMALADQAAGHPHGFANPVFYGLAFNNGENASGGSTSGCGR